VEGRTGCARKLQCAVACISCCVLAHVARMSYGQCACALPMISHGFGWQFPSLGSLACVASRHSRACVSSCSAVIQCRRSCTRCVCSGLVQCVLACPGPIGYRHSQRAKQPSAHPVRAAVVAPLTEAALVVAAHPQSIKQVAWGLHTATACSMLVLPEFCEYWKLVGASKPVVSKRSLASPIQKSRRSCVSSGWQLLHILFRIWQS
jgi:hypothetical protein